ncbi:MAG: hypothetical protein UT41_C0003G0023 [Candidatus Wolfebacteria bacterium GW2011_GWC2_39_22]|uniref:Uncharacterized protein n=1 Tax=Candidatus Wolfebacteria bacterium GW2011_GWC2_39_22 TaxID=1619013 RepID=A0A0G0NH35_9BACT|nr:MAG: hypothetical protein UT41_C0003G0023 [Candidatus Wolfebacteria bacterium GW2011_GWC2_39_22]
MFILSTCDVDNMAIYGAATIKIEGNRARMRAIDKIQ